MNIDTTQRNTQMEIFANFLLLYIYIIIQVVSPIDKLLDRVDIAGQWLLAFFRDRKQKLNITRCKLRSQFMM